MIWLTWRQFRSQAAAVYVAVAAFAVVLAITGPRLVQLQRLDRDALFDRLTSTERSLYYTCLVVVIVAPAVVGAFWGAPLVARELEAGTHRLAWNQSVTRTRWLAVKLGVTAAAAVAAVSVLSLAVSWWSGPLDGAVSTTRGGFAARLSPLVFDARGIAPLGYAAFAFILGVSVGLVLRRALPAMAVTLAVLAFVQIAVPHWVRPHLAATTQHTVTISDSNFDGISGGPGLQPQLTVQTGNRGDWVLSNDTVDGAGHVVALPSVVTDCLEPPPPAGGVARAPSIEPCLAKLSDLGYRQRVVYQPAGNFWALQWAETAMYLGVCGLLTWFCFWWIRHRVG